MITPAKEIMSIQAEVFKNEDRYQAWIKLMNQELEKHARTNFYQCFNCYIEDEFLERFKTDLELSGYYSIKSFKCDKTNKSLVAFCWRS